MLAQESRAMAARVMRSAFIGTRSGSALPYRTVVQVEKRTSGRGARGEILLA